MCDHDVESHVHTASCQNAVDMGVRMRFKENNTMFNQVDYICDLSPSSSPSKLKSVALTVHKFSTSSLFIVIVLISITYFSCPHHLVQRGGKPTVQHVWYFGWICALVSGFGVLPLIFAPNMNKFWIGVSNAVAAGMMIAASYSLVEEGCMFHEPGDTSVLSPLTRTLLGVVLGLSFILCTKSFLEKHEDIHVGSLAGADARRIVLIIFVMTLHAFAEGVGIGVSFGGSNGRELGVFISASLAVHNVPEGLAVAIALLPRKIPKLTVALWCIATSIPQPLMAVPSFLFVHYFIPILPVGLGFAGGAMAWVALFELLMEAYEDTSAAVTAVISLLSMSAMFWMQIKIDEGSKI